MGLIGQSICSKGLGEAQISIDPSAWQLTLQEPYTQSLHDSLLPQSLLYIALGQRLTHAEGQQH